MSQSFHKVISYNHFVSHFIPSHAIISYHSNSYRFNSYHFICYHISKKERDIFNVTVLMHCNLLLQGRNESTFSLVLNNDSTNMSAAGRWAAGRWSFPAFLSCCKRSVWACSTPSICIWSDLTYGGTWRKIHSPLEYSPCCHFSHNFPRVDDDPKTPAKYNSKNLQIAASKCCQGHIALQGIMLLGGIEIHIICLLLLFHIFMS